MFMGYATNHAADVYRMLDLDTKKITISRDIRWLNKNYSEWKHEKNKEEFYEENEPSIKNKETVSKEEKNNEDKDVETEEEAKPKSSLEKQLDIDTHEDIGDVEERAKGPRTLRSGRELNNMTWNISDLHVALLMHRVE